MPAGPQAYWGSPEGWRALTRARLLAGTGERERAIAMLRSAVDHGHAHAYLHLHDDPDFDLLRGHAAFESLLRPQR